MRHHPAFWILLAGVAVPLLSEIPLGFRVRGVRGHARNRHRPACVGFGPVHGPVEMLRNYTKAQRLPFALSAVLFPTIAGAMLGKAAKEPAIEAS